MWTITAVQSHLTLEKIETNFGYTEIKLDKVNIIKSYDTILHLINPREITSIIDNLETNIRESDLQKENITLQYQIESIRNKVKTLIPHRQRRGLFNFIGTTFKWLYGSMDDNDRQDIEDHLKTVDTNSHNVIENLNSQVKINRNFNETFTKLKETILSDRTKILNQVNEIKNYNNVLYRQTIYTDFVLKLKILQDNIEHIQDNIASARLGIIHSNILTNEEIVEYNVDFEKLQNIKLGTLIDDKDNIVFIIKIPKEMINVQKTLLIPLGDNQNKELIFEPQEIIKYQNKTYNYVKNINLKNLSICNNCITNKNCNRKFNNISEIIELEEGIVLVKNQFNVNFSSTCDERKIVLNGNYLISFNNCSIKINNNVIQNKRKEFKQSFAIPNYLENIKERNKNLVFDEIVLEQIGNIKEIKELKYVRKTHYIYAGIITVLFIIAAIVIGIYIVKIKRSNLIINKFIETRESPNSKEGGVTSAKFVKSHEMKRDQGSHFISYNL